MESTSPPDLSLERYFIENMPYLKLIHLCDIFGSGYGKGRHGVPFRPETKEKLNKILEYYIKYKCQCPITLEVEETDYKTCDGYKKTKKMVDEGFANVCV